MYMYVLRGGVRKTLHVKKMADLVAGKFIALLSFELSSFGENGVLVLLYFLCCGR